MDYKVITVHEDEVEHVYIMYDDVQDATTLDDYNNGYRSFLVR